MSDIQISQLESTYVLQALKHMIVNIATTYQDLDFDNCSEEELQEFTNEQIFLNDLLLTHHSLIEKYKSIYQEDSNMAKPEFLDLSPKIDDLLTKFFPKLD